MSHTYYSFDPVAVVNGNTLQALSAAFNSPTTARQLLRHNGLPAEPEAESWYLLQHWLNVLAEVETVYGPETVYAIGLQIIANSRWPEDLTTLAQAIYALDEACRSNIQGAPIGYYRVEELGVRNMRVEVLTPTPADFERGILTGMARRYKPSDSLRVLVNQEVPPASAPLHFKWFRIRW